MTPDVRRTETDGILTLVSDVPGQLTGSLVFGIGRRDEAPRSAGLAHLVEHLVMARLGHPPVGHNAYTTDEGIVFTAHGTPDRVAQFLADVSKAIRDIADTTDAEVAAQRRIIAAELGDGDELPGAGHLLDRYGAAGLGLLDLGSPAHRSLTREQAIDFAHRWLHAGNAALTLSGPLPETVRLPLPQARPVAARNEQLPEGRNGWYRAAGPGVIFSIVFRHASREAVILASATVAAVLQSELRTERHLIYSVEPVIFDVGTDRVAVYVMDAPSEQAVDAAQHALVALRRLRDEGPNHELLPHVLTDWENAVADPEMHREAIVELAISILRGRRRATDLDLPDVRKGVSDVGALVGGALDSLLMTVGGYEAGTEEDLTEALGVEPLLSASAPHYGTMTRWQRMRALTRASIFAPKPLRGLRGHQVVIDPERVTYIDPVAGTVEVPFDDIVLAGHDASKGAWAITAVQGDTLVLATEDWRNGASLETELRERIDGTRLYPIGAAAKG